MQEEHDTQGETSASQDETGLGDPADQAESSAAQTASRPLQGFQLPHNPEGWFCVGLADSWKKGDVRTCKLVGTELVVYRTASGVLQAIDAWCPHMGAHFGFGGKVDGETIRCPFHGFRFDGQGACVKTEYPDSPLPPARAHTWPIQEVNGFVFVYHHPDGNAPTWTIPALPDAGWGKIYTRAWPLSAHPQETTENSVDIGHLAAVHLYSGVETLKPMRGEGPYLTAHYAMHRSAGVFGKAGEVMRAEFEIHAWGFGYSFVDVFVPQYGLHTRHFVLATPRGPGEMELRIALRLEDPKDPSKIHAALGYMPMIALRKILGRAAFEGFAGDVRQDFVIWQNKKYIHPPQLARGDGPVGRYRKWSRQFYRPADRHLVG